ncbi:MAG: DUF2341 domain-containing protein, partial [Verrucomicrobiota bacterium]
MAGRFFTGELRLHVPDGMAAEPGIDTGLFEVVRPAAGSSVSQRVYYAVSGTASNGTDVESLNGYVDLPVGSTSAFITVRALDDRLIESNETVTVTLLPGGYAVGTPDSGVVLLADDDTYAPSNTMSITFCGYDQAETLSHFPALIVLGTNIPGFDYSTFLFGTGDDLRFVTGDESMFLPYDIETWNTNGLSYVWVQIDRLIDSNTLIHAAWGDPAWTAPPGYTTDGSTWSDEYLGVWHLSEAVAGGEAVGALHLDSTSNMNHGVQNRNDDTNGLVGLSQDFDGDDHITIPPLNGGGLATNRLSVFVLVNGNKLIDWSGIFYSRSGTRAVGVGYGDNGTDVRYTWNNNSPLTFDFVSSLFIPVDEWALVGLVVEPSRAVLYLGTTNGLTAVTNAIPHIIEPLDAEWRLAQDNCCGGTRYMDGALDEARVVATDRSLAWVSAMAANLLQTDGFLCFNLTHRIVDLRLTKTVSSTNLLSGSNLVYTLDVANLSMETASNVVVTDS